MDEVVRALHGDDSDASGSTATAIARSDAAARTDFGRGAARTDGGRKAVRTDGGRDLTSTEAESRTVRTDGGEPDGLAELLGAYVVVDDADPPVVADCSEQFAEFLDRDADAVIGTAFPSLFADGTDAAAVLRGGEADADTGRESETDGWSEATLRAADGATVPVRYRTATDAPSLAGTDGTVVTFVDDSERRNLASQVEWYETLVNTVPDAIYALDEDMHYLFVNEGMADLTGYDREEIIGSHKSFVNTDESVESGRLKRQDLRENDREGMKVALHPHVTADGEQIPTEVRFRALPTDDDDEFRGTAGVVRDVSARIEREEELERQNRRLEEFASIVSHDLRNPMNVAVGRIELAREDCTCGRVDEHLAKADDELDRMDGIIDDVLSFARHGREVTDVEPVDLGGVAQSAWSAVGGERRRLAVEADLAVEANELRLQRLLENLFRNATEHAGDDVSVRVGSLFDADALPDSDAVDSPGDPAAVSGFYVEDDGPGIPAEMREQVLDPGVTTAEKGTGFGLAIVKAIAESHGWSLAVTEGEDGGARFEFTDVELADAADESAERAGAS